MLSYFLNQISLKIKITSSETSLKVSWDYRKPRTYT